MVTSLLGFVVILEFKEQLVAGASIKSLYDAPTKEWHWASKSAQAPEETKAKEHAKKTDVSVEPSSSKLHICVQRYPSHEDFKCQLDEIDINDNVYSYGDNVSYNAKD